MHPTCGLKRHCDHVVVGAVTLFVIVPFKGIALQCSNGSSRDPENSIVFLRDYVFMSGFVLFIFLSLEESLNIVEVSRRCSGASAGGASNPRRSRRRALMSGGWSVIGGKSGFISAAADVLALLAFCVASV